MNPFCGKTGHKLNFVLKVCSPLQKFAALKFTSDKSMRRILKQKIEDKMNPTYPESTTATVTIETVIEGMGMGRSLRSEVK